ncbi:sulfotransferase [Congregibacter sp.]|nr:sulfotransferase domain-containing protein [Congregibacter sp.]MDA8962012.1 sulfotransferase [Congregibacter sp.]
MTTRPYFIGIGAQRSATSWLYECLRVHPQIYMPRKEMQFFNKHYDKGIDWYFRHFDNTPEGCYAGEFTPDYLSSPEAVSRLHENLPDAKLIVILREPLERAFSAFQLYRSHGDYQGLSFREAIEFNPALIRNGLYFEQLSTLFKFFPREQVEIFLHEEVVVSASDVYLRTCEFLGIDTSFVPDSLDDIRNSSAYVELQSRFGVNRMANLYRTPSLHWVRKILNATGIKEWVRVRLSEKLRSKEGSQSVGDDVLEMLISDTRKLGPLIGIDLSIWNDRQLAARRFTDF